MDGDFFSVYKEAIQYWAKKGLSILNLAVRRRSAKSKSTTKRLSDSLKKVRNERLMNWPKSTTNLWSIDAILGWEVFQHQFGKNLKLIVILPWRHFITFRRFLLKGQEKSTSWLFYCEVNWSGGFWNWNILQGCQQNNIIVIKTKTSLLKNFCVILFAPIHPFDWFLTDLSSTLKFDDTSVLPWVDFFSFKRCSKKHPQKNLRILLLLWKRFLFSEKKKKKSNKIASQKNHIKTRIHVLKKIKKLNDEQGFRQDTTNNNSLSTFMRILWLLWGSAQTHWLSSSN